MGVHLRMGTDSEDAFRNHVWLRRKCKLQTFNTPHAAVSDTVASAACPANVDAIHQPPNEARALRLTKPANMNLLIRFLADSRPAQELTATLLRSSLLKRALLAAAALLSVFALAGNAAADTPAAGSFAGGNGTQGNPFQISNLAELRRFMESAPIFPNNSYYQLTANIEASDTGTWLGGLGWLPVDASLLDGFDPAGFEIQNLQINRPTTNNVGFFGKTDALFLTLDNFKFVGGQITGQDYVGTLIGLGGNAMTVSNSQSTATVSGRSNVGGLAGLTGDGSIVSSSAAGTVTGTGDIIGGLVGNAAGGSVSLSHATGHVTGKRQVGGLAGVFTQGSGPGLTASWASGQVDGDDLVGGLIGNSNSKVTFSYATGVVTATGTNPTIVGYALVGGLIGQQSSARATEDSWASGAVSGPLSGVGGLIGSNAGPILRSIAIAGQTVTGGASAGSVGGLVGDNKGSITSSSSASTVNASGAAVESIGGLVGISAAGTGITNSYATGAVNAANAVKVGGLIGWHTTGAVNGSHAHGDVSGAGNVGGLIGLSTTPAVNTSYATGSVSGATMVGGLIGNRGSGTTDTTFATGTVTATGDYAGGLIGFNTGAIKKSYANPGAVSGQNRVGGLAGYNQGTVETSYAIKTVTGINFVGGLVGQSASNSFGVRDCYAKGSVTGSDKIGGLVGRNEAASNIAQCYASGTVTLSGAGSIGALVGDNQAAANANNYWNTSSAGLVGVGTGAATNVNGLTSAQMKQGASFAGFNFSTPWRIDETVSEPYFNFGGTLDVDHSITGTKYDAHTDGVIVVRYLFGLTGDALVSGALGGTATRTDPIAIKDYLDGIRPSLDIDGSGNAYALTDGLLIVRYLLGLTGPALISGAVDTQNGTRTTATKIQNYLQSLMP